MKLKSVPIIQTLKTNSYSSLSIFFIALSIYFYSCDDSQTIKYSIANKHDTALSIQNPIAQNESGFKVIGIKDGDTFVLLIDGKEQTVRLAHIDCPEKNQPFGTKAKQFASDLCFGKYVTLAGDKKYDRNKRQIAEVVMADGKIVNKELVKNGFAWHFKKYSDSKEYAQLEKNARDKKTGLWSEPNPVEPWNWRKRKKI